LVDLTLVQYARFFTTYLRPLKWRVLGLALLLFSGVGLQLASPQIVRTFIDTAQTGGAPTVLALAALLYLGVALATQAVAVGETYVAENVGWLATNALRADLAELCLRLDLSFHTSHTPGELIERIDGDVSALANFFSRFVLRILGSALFLVGVLVLVFREEWRAGLALLTFSLIALAVLTGLRRVGIHYTIARRQGSAELFGFLEERLAGRIDVQAIGARDYAMSRALGLLDRLSQRARVAAAVGGGLGAITGFLFGIGMVLSLGLGAYLYLNGSITMGTVYLLFQYTVLLQAPLGQITREVQDFQSAGASLVRIQRLRELPVRIVDGPSTRLPGGPLALDLGGVTFGYDPDRAVLHGVSLRLEPGQVLGLLGRTGSGKSTIGRLIFRMYDPNLGAVRLGDVDVRELRLADLEARVGLVTQDVQLFHATLRDNVTLFNPEVSDIHVRRVLNLLGLGGWLDRQPDGLATELGSGGLGVSAGEAQLLAFARVFVKDPSLIILDEASSRLDPATERLVETAIDRLLAGRTAIVIAHRLSTIRRADVIAIVEDGRIVEQGSRVALSADPSSRLSQLIRTGLAEVLA
jgi:ATP-binding cassette, subfamily B, bacterial